MRYVWFVRGAEHAALCQVSMAAALRADPIAERTVVTDDPKVTIPGAEMLRFEPGLPLMVANLEGQLAAMAEHWDEQLVFLDTDVLFLKPFPRELSEKLIVTWRDSLGGTVKDNGVLEAMPYNYGVLSVVPGARTFEAMTWLRNRIRQMAPQFQVWWGNQMALAALCGPRPEVGEMIESRMIPWHLTIPGPRVLVRKLPGAIWNYTPASEDEDLAARGAVHFKGHTRPWMESVVKRLELPWRNAA